jgi:hypothetical protein
MLLIEHNDIVFQSFALLEFFDIVNLINLISVGVKLIYQIIFTAVAIESSAGKSILLHVTGLIIVFITSYLSGS